MTDGILFQALIYLLAAVITVPLAKRFGLGSVLGYLIAGIAIGPSALGLVGDVEDVQHFAEFGVVIMLFVVGLELRPSLLWKLRGPILGLGGAQVLTTALVVTFVTMGLGQTWPVGLTLGLILAMSSTAIVIQSLTERGMLHTRGGEACFAVLLFQDIAVIPILAMLPWLARVAGANATGTLPHSPIEQLPQWIQTSVTLGAVAAVVIVSNFGLRYVFRYVAASRLREMLTAVALLVVAGVAWLMHLVGLSAALGTFVAGVVLAESEYRHQLEADVEPFKVKRGVDLFRRDTLASAVDLGVDALQELGVDEDRAVRAGRIFMEHDETALREMAPHYGTDEARYISLARQHMKNLESVLKADAKGMRGEQSDAGETTHQKREPQE